jgi:tetrathionate reductase subunit B
LAAHADDPMTVTPVKPDTAVLCARCHTASAAKPVSFPQVDPADHSGGVPCETCHNPHSPIIGSDSSASENGEGRREMKISRRHLMILLPAAAVAWKHVLAGTPEDSPNYQMSEHWWGMLIDIPKCIGCGNCVRACQTENDVPDGFFRTWVERYHRTDWHLENPEVISPDGGKEGFPVVQAGEEGKFFFVPKMCNHCADSPCTQVCPVGATFVTPDGVVLIDQKYCLGCAYCVQACPYGCRYIHPTKKVADKCTLCYHRITKGLTTACCEACPTGARQLADLKNPNDPIHEFLKTHTVQVLKPQMATGAKAFYNGLDGSVR